MGDVVDINSAVGRVNAPPSPNDELAEAMASFFADPLGFVVYAYPWDTDPSIQVVEMPEPWASRYNSFYGPDRWACELLDKIGALVKEHGFVPGGPAVQAIREAITSGHGIGKSAIVAWLVDWIMSTRPLSQGTVTAVTYQQLQTKTWAQIPFWTTKSITAHWFKVTGGKGSMAMRHRAHPDRWFCTAQTCDKENSEAFAGQHAPTATSFYFMDEASGIDDKIHEVSEGGLMTGEPMKFAFGNPTETSGWFYKIFNTDAGKKRWGRKHIDSREVQITNKKFIGELIEDHGIDSDWVKVRVRGMFPKMSAKQFISTADVDAAHGRSLPPRAYEFAPIILALDNSWEGDDEGAIVLRQGLVSRVLRTFAKNDNDMDIANLLAQLEETEKADAVYIDYGYGTGVFSAGKSMGRDWKLVNFGAASPKLGYLNMRAYIWGEMRDWLKGGGAIPKDQILYDDLVNIQTVSRGHVDGTIQLESKKDMKARGVSSPNRGDALAITFAYPAQKKLRGIEAQLKAQARKRKDHNPYDSLGSS